MSCRDTVSIYRRRPKCLPSTVNDAKDNVQEPDAADTTAISCNPGRSTRRKSRPSWIDRSLSCRSKTNSLDAYAFSSSRQDNDKAKKAFLSPNVYRKKRVEAPANFVQDQKNYFAQVDAFELEEETPPSKERWMHELQQKDAVIPGVQFYRTGLLQAVQEDSHEKSLQETSLFALSSQKDPLRHILETPHADQSSQISRSRGLLECSSRSEKGFLADVEVITGGFPKSRKTHVTNELASQVPNNGQTHPKVPSQSMLCGIDQEALKHKPAMGLEHSACCKPLLNLKESIPHVISISDDDEDEDLGQIPRSKTFSGSYDAVRFNLKDSVQLFKPETFSGSKDPARQAPRHDEVRAKPETRHQSKLHLIDFDALESKQDGSQPLMNSKSDVCSHAVRVKYEYNTEPSTNNDSHVKAKDAVIPDLAVVASEASNLREESKMSVCSVEDDKSHHEAPERLVEELQNLHFQDSQGEGFFKSSELHEQCIMQHALVKNSPQSNTEQLPIFEVLLKKCGQKAPVPLKKAILQFSDMSDIVKLGEGTYGEAFRGSNLVFKIVPMDGDFRVNGEVQKTSADMYTEMLLTLTLNRLRGANSEFALQHNVCNNFIETKMVKVCQGLYDQELINAWEEWDANHGSENDNPVVFPKKQLYMLFVLADGGQDLESFAIASFDVARSILIQVTAALAIAEEDCEFEHRDLHWGNILVAQTEQAEAHCKLDGRDMHLKTCGVFVHIIDFTLSRLHTGKKVLFSNLSADPLLFEGRKGDIQAETYRRMLHITKGHWDKRFLKTNCYWIHYLINVLLTKKQFHSLREEDRALRAFKKRVLSYESAKACLEDEFFDPTRRE